MKIFKRCLRRAGSYIPGDISVITRIVYALNVIPVYYGRDENDLYFWPKLFLNNH